MISAIILAALSLPTLTVEDGLGPDPKAPSLTCMARLEAERDMALGNGAKAFTLAGETTMMWRNGWVKIWCEGPDMLYVGEKDGKPL